MTELPDKTRPFLLRWYRGLRAARVAYAMKPAADLPKDRVIIVNLSGRGDKDVAQVADKLDGRTGGVREN